MSSIETLCQNVVFKFIMTMIIIMPHICHGALPPPSSHFSLGFFLPTPPSATPTSTATPLGDQVLPGRHQPRLDTSFPLPPCYSASLLKRDLKLNSFRSIFYSDREGRFMPIDNPISAHGNTHSEVSELRSMGVGQQTSG